MLAKTGAERSVDDFVSLRTAMKYYDNLAKRKRRLKKKVKVPLVVIFLLIFIGPESDHWLCLSVTHSLTDSLTHCCLVNLIDVTLACEDANSKLVEVVTVAGAFL